MSDAQQRREGAWNESIYTLTGHGGLRAQVCNAGASLLRVYAPDRNGELKNIALCFDSSAARIAGGSYAGATIGPVAGRVRGGVLRLPQGPQQLLQNDGANTLHGGPHALDEARWETGTVAPERVSFHCRLHDGQNGFPGNRTLCVRYTLDTPNSLAIAYTAETDRATFLNLTSHAYWNLTGDFSADAYNHVLEVAADSVLYNDSAHLPVGTRPVRDTPFDFTAPRTLRAAMDADAQNAQLANARGYNNAYHLRPSAPFAARLTDPASGRRLTLHTDYPALVVYSGGYLPAAGCAIALEAQFAPDTCAPVLFPGEIYRRTLRFVFDTV